MVGYYSRSIKIKTKQMILANELRVGNYIKLYRKPSDKEMRYHKIKSIFFNDRLKEYLIELEDGFCVNISKGIEPIPLTEDILLKCGFDKKRLAFSSVFCLNGFCIYETFDLEQISEGFHIRLHKEIKVEFFHKLQNIYLDLEEKELEVNL